VQVTRVSECVRIARVSACFQHLLNTKSQFECARNRPHLHRPLNIHTRVVDVGRQPLYESFDVLVIVQLCVTIKQYCRVFAAGHVPVMQRLHVLCQLHNALSVEQLRITFIA
jgi:hypothetical protein